MQDFSSTFELVRIRSSFLTTAAAAAAGFLALHGCALPAAPTGGPKDETPPQITQSEPAHTQVRVSPQEIRIQFNEFVALGSNGGRPISSPPLPGTVRVTLQGKSARIRWDGGPLLPDATYSLALGGCFKDITEGNLLPATALVFATGNQLDSLYWAGFLRDARSGKPLSDWAVGLWPADAPDSAAYLGLPRYTSRTDEDGRFALNYLPAGSFRLLAFEDADGNSKVNQGEKPRWAWEVNPIAPRSTLDSSQTSTLWAVPVAAKDSVAPWPNGLDLEKSGTVRLKLTPSTATLAGHPLVEWVDAAGVVRWTRRLSAPLDTVFSNITPGRSALRVFLDRDRNGAYSPGDFWLGQQPERGWDGPTVEAKANWETETVWDLTEAPSTPERPAKKAASDGSRAGIPDALRRRR